MTWFVQLFDSEEYLLGSCVLGLWALIRIKECALFRINFTLQEATLCFSDDKEEKCAIRSQKRREVCVGRASTYA